MAYTNSPLVSYTQISPNRTKNRNHPIDTITIHCVVGQCSVQTLGAVFAPTSRQASSNYGIGYDGKIGMYCEEKDRSWCTSSSANDNRAITIEVASDTTHPYAVNDKAYSALIDLCTDICKRNGIKELKWKADKALVGQVDKQNMTVHRWFSDTICPGEHLYNLHGKIAADVNARLGVVSNPANPPVSAGTTPAFKVGDIVKITGKTYYNGTAVPSWVAAKLWIVHSVSGDRVVLNKSKDGKSAIMSPFKAEDIALDVATAPTTPSPTPGGNTSSTSPTPSAQPSPPLKFKVGDIVNFNGNKHYTSPDGSTGSATKASKAKITVVQANSKHPYHCRAVNDAGAFVGGVYGWVNAADVSAVIAEAPAAKPVTPVTSSAIKKGDIVSVATNATYYNGVAVPKWVTAKTWVVSSNPVGDRVVINKSADGASAINSPINAKYLTVVSSNEPWTPKVGDIVNYNGDKHYANANASSGSSCKGGQAKITNIYQLGKSKHPYHLVRVSGRGASVYGWVDEGTFTKA